MAALETQEDYRGLIERKQQSPVARYQQTCRLILDYSGSNICVVVKIILLLWAILKCIFPLRWSINMVIWISYCFFSRREGPDVRCQNFRVRINVFKEKNKTEFLYGAIENSDRNKKVPCPEPVSDTCKMLKGKLTWEKVWPKFFFFFCKSVVKIVAETQQQTAMASLAD